MLAQEVNVNIMEELLTQAKAKTSSYLVPLIMRGKNDINSQQALSQDTSKSSMKILSPVMAKYASVSVCKCVSMQVC